VSVRAALLVATLVAAQSTFQSSGTAEGALWSALSPKLEVGKGKSTFDEALCAKELAARGPELARPALRILLGDAEEPAHDYDVDPRAIDARPRVLGQLLKALPRADVLKAVDEEVAAKEGVNRQLLLVRVLADVGGKESLDRVVAIASKLDPVQWERNFVQSPVQEAIAALVRGDPTAQKEIARKVQDSKPGLGVMFVRALAQAGATAAVPELGYSLGRDPKLDLCISDALGALAESAAGTLSESALGALRAQIESGDARLVCAAASTLGRLGDEVSAEKLVRLLGDPDALKKHGALTGLSALGGRDRAGDQAEWQAWLEAENTWRNERLPEIEKILSAEDLKQLPNVLSELVGHRLFRHKVAMDLTPLLESKNPDVVRLACGVLPLIGSRSVVPALKMLVRSGNRETIACGRAALIALQPPSAGS
jgi:HEAT repeat protein